jgi:hypothetical protein
MRYTHGLAEDENGPQGLIAEKGGEGKAFFGQKLHLLLPLL